MLVPFAPPPGINSDDTPNAAEGQWVDGSNVRFRLGKPETIGAPNILIDVLVTAGDTVYDIFAFNRAGVGKVAFATTGRVLVGDFSGITSRLAAGATTGYSFAAWGDTLLAAAWGAKLYDQSGTSAAAEVIEAPDRIDGGIIVTPERQVVAFATNEVGGTFNSRCIRISDTEDYSGAGSWTPTASNNADEIILDFPIICGRQVGPYVCVWTTTALYLGQFIGDPSQTYRFDKVADVPCPLTVRSVASWNGLVYWMGYDLQMRVWSPGAQPQIIPCPVSRDMTDHSFAAPGHIASYLVTNTQFGEVWFFYDDSRDATSRASRYIAYSATESALAGRPVWFRGQLARSAMVDSEIIRGMTGNSFGLSVLGSAEPVDISTSPVTYLHDRHDDDVIGYIQSADFYIDNSQRRVMVRGVIPDFEYQDNPVALTLFVKDRPQSTAVTKGPYSLVAGATKKDFRASGKMVAAKFSSVMPAVSSSGRFRIGKTLFDVVPTGER